ncbi:homologous-pairing protein 2 homolog isoform X1 [Sitophilus oryzae]|uniref:Homologous-pairing protein 2 homolog n=1 Tax=Sitophilus oryzae TaxID=7048 RepID=A0A6J2XZZ2_SITOR|nr:homologous-pairing protein 2 homolog isoform X1 [Sitophilus oryzae]
MVKKSVLDFLETQNRPYSITDIQNNFGKEYGKSAIQKALDNLVENGQVKEKLYGKQKVYFVSQETKKSNAEISEELKMLDRKINEISLDLKEKKQKIKILQAEIGMNAETLTLPQAIMKKSDLKNEICYFNNSLEEFDGEEMVSDDEKKEVMVSFNKSLETYKKRKRLCKDILDIILENYPKSKKNLMEDIGIETDEDVGFIFSV